MLVRKNSCRERIYAEESYMDGKAWRNFLGGGNGWQVWDLTAEENDSGYLDKMRCSDRKWEVSLIAQ